MTNTTRRAFVTAGLGAAALAATAQPLPAAAADRKPAGWDKLVDAARQEGQLVIYGAPSNENYTALVTRFQQAYPGIKVDGVFGYGSDLQTRIFAERAAGRYLPDVFVNGSTVPLRGLKPSGALAPLEPLIVLPEILDAGAWFQDELWWTDATVPPANWMFSGVMIPLAYVNTTLAKPADFNSYWDFVAPKWRGKIVSNDIRIPGPGGVPARFVYKHAGLGRPWFERFFGTLDVVLGHDQRQLVDWLSQGRYPIAAFIDEDVAQLAIEQGLPIAPVPIDRMKEGGAVAPGPGTVSVLNHTPHPNAAKLYLNWLLSREGQIAWQEETHTASLRVDIPKHGLYLEPQRKRGMTYANGGSEEYSLVTGTVFTSMISDILKKAGRA
jgi:ABC-type Fe3+ transport system substrate-binding protein